jgi:hypothetical protein
MTEQTELMLATDVSDVTDLDIILFASQYATRIEYEHKGQPAKLHWTDKLGDHVTTGANTREAHINALLEKRKQPNEKS